MNKGTPADPLREAAEALHGYMKNLTGIPPEGFLWDDLRAALATKPAETPALYELALIFNTKPGDTASLLAMAKRAARALALGHALGHPTESAGKSPEAVSGERWTDAHLRGIASNYFPDQANWPAAMLCLRHMLMEQSKDTQRSSNANGSDDETAWIASLQPGERGASVQPPTPEPVAWLHHYHKIGGGRTYVEADVCDPRYKFAPASKPGFEWVRVEPLYATPSIAQRGAPVGEVVAVEDGLGTRIWQKTDAGAALPAGTLLYAGAAQRGAALTDERIDRIWEKHWRDDGNYVIPFARAIEAEVRALSPERPK